MTEEHVQDLLPAYALDALEIDEAQRVADHLRNCAQCREELRRIRGVTDALADALPQTLPPPGLRRRILEAVRPPQRRVRRWTTPAAWAAVAAAFALALAGAALSLNQRLQALQARLAAQEQTLALLAAPTTRTVELTGTLEGSVRFVFIPGQREGALIAADLRDPGGGLVYQLWLVAGTQPESAGVFRPQAGRPVIVRVSADFARYQAVAISVEVGPRGANQPTAAPVLVGRL